MGLRHVFEHLAGHTGQVRYLLDLALHVLQQLPGAHALAHPALEIRLAGAPQIQVRIQLAAQTLDVEQGLLQQHQLRLHFHVEAPCHLEQPDQQLTEGDVFQRLLEDGLAHGTDRRLELVDLGFRRHPARIDVQLRHLAVVALEEGHQVARQVILVFRCEAADDAEVHCDVLRVPRLLGADEDVAGVHVCMEEAVAEDLGEENLHAAFGELLHVGALFGQPGHVGDRHAVDALHHQYLRAAVIPVDLRHVEQRRILEVAPELAGVGGLAQQVEFVVDGLGVVLDHLHQVQAAGIDRRTLGGLGQQEQPGQVLADDRLEIGPHHLDHHFLAAAQLRRMHLSHRRGGQRLAVEAGEHFAHRRTQLALDQGGGHGRVEGRYAILQHRQLFGDVQRQQVPAGRENLAELDEDRPQAFQRQAQARAARQRAASPRQPAPGQQITGRAQPPGHRQVEDDVVQAVADHHQQDAEQAAGGGEQLHSA